MGDDHDDHNDDRIHVYCFKIEGDGTDEDWASYSDIAHHEIKPEDLSSAESLFKKLENDDVFKGKYSDDPFETKRSGRNGLDLYLSPPREVSKVICAFMLPPVPPKVKAAAEARGQKVGLEFDKDSQFQIGDAGWAEPARAFREFYTEDIPRWAAFQFDVDMCRDSDFYKKARAAREFLFVRFPIMFRVHDRKLGVPACMVPNTHSPSDRGRFGKPGQLRVAEMMNSIHTHGYEMETEGTENADRNDHEHGHGHEHGNEAQTVSATEDSPVGILRHFGPHFVGSYTVHLEVD